ncbi:MAG: hypothetical protein EPN21_09715 [Methylococcaceae bacterium]|nr:MAG: hypothetical protein EPN21_09715 [Methylococcaceae bacterium]
MNICPRPDQELAIQEAIRVGLISSEVDALDIGLEHLRIRLVERMFIGRKAPETKVIHAFNKAESDSQGFSRTPQEAAAHICELRKGNLLPNGITIRDLIHEGRP